MPAPDAPVAAHQFAPEEVRAAWDKVVEAWDEQSRHDALLGLVARAGAFAWAAARYRERAGDPKADTQLDRIQRAATAALFVTGTKRADGKTPYKSSIIALLVLVVMLVIGVLFAVARVNSQAARPTLPATR